MLEKRQKIDFSSFLIYIYFWEACLGGGGRIFARGSVTLRKLIFIILLAVFLFYMVNYKKLIYHTTAMWGVILFVYCCFSSALGILKGNTVSAALSDLQPVIYLVIFYPILILQKKANLDTKKIIKIITYSATIISVITLALVFFEKLKGISAYDFRTLLSQYLPQNEFGIRKNGSLFLVSHFYVSIAAVFTCSNLLYNQSKKSDIFLLVLYILAILQSSTRSAIVALAIALGYLVLEKLFINRGRMPKNVVVFILAGLIGVICLLPFVDYSRFLNFSDKSTMIRIGFIKESLELFKNNPFWGSGYGTKLISKGTAHLECSYLEILLEQGIAGLSIWIFFISSFLFQWQKLRVKNRDCEFVRYGAIASLAVLLLTSFFNPYINNPVGISALCTLTVLYETVKCKKEAHSIGEE